jgi:2-succinyl-6-hydroxy-2,4-cyclohexadiene-1-carboxylate synthase
MMATIELQGYVWHLREDGDPALPPLLLLHGFTGCVEFWDDVVHGLCGSFRCIRVDLPGHGRTRAPDDTQAYAMEQVAPALVTLLDHLQIKRTHLWGYSMGGRLALYLAVSFPECVDRLIIESASPGISNAVERDQRRDADERLAAEIERDGVPAFVDRWMSQPLFATQTRLPLSCRAQARRWRLLHTAAGLAHSLRGMGAGVQPPLTDALPTLTCPTLILTGEHDAKFHAIGAAMAQSVPTATCRIIADCGHAPHWEQPDACVSVARPFLNGQTVATATSAPIDNARI